MKKLVYACVLFIVSPIFLHSQDITLAVVNNTKEGFTVRFSPSCKTEIQIKDNRTEKVILRSLQGKNTSSKRIDWTERMESVQVILRQIDAKGKLLEKRKTVLKESNFQVKL